MICGATHPEHPERVCKRTPPHIDHDDATGDPEGMWTTEADQRAHRIRKENKPGRRRGQKVLTRLGAEVAMGRRTMDPGVPTEALTAWSKEAWQPYAMGVFQRFLTQRVTPFTTAEDVWPLLHTPEEMRAMVVVVRRMLSTNLMVEEGAKRLRGVYHTLDGDEFAENKLVPIYRSLICDSATE